MGNKKLSNKALDILQKAHGKGGIFNLNEGPDISIDRWPSGSLDLDRILGGGWPKGRICEIYGPSSAGKSSVIQAAIASVQQNGGLCAYVDMECTYDDSYGESLGIDNDALLYSAPDSGEDALDLIRDLANTGEVDLIVLDSSNACTPAIETESDMGDASMAVQARMFSKAMRVFTPALKKSGALLLIISQMRDKIGGYGDPRKIGVGNAIYYADSIRLEVLGSKAKEVDGEAVGHTMRFYTVKNKTYRPKMRGEAFFEYYKGFCEFNEVVELGAAMGIIDKAGSWYSYKDTKLGQGASKVADILRDNPDLFDELKTAVIEGLKQQ